jgi:signal transduction histidine kinase/ligand-binding sensor domain-containing protein
MVRGVINKMYRAVTHHGFAACSLAVAAFAADTDIAPADTRTAPVTVSWDESAGLPSARIDGISRTSDGYLWLAGPAGLCRFDGVRFRILHPQAEAGPAMTGMAAAMTRRDGSLWSIDGKGRLFVRSGERLSDAGLEGVLDNRPVLAFAEGPDGCLWLATDGELIGLKAGQISRLGSEDGFPKAPPQHLTVDESGRLWFLADGFLFVVEGGGVRRLGGAAKLPAPALALTRARGGGIWAATQGPRFGGTRIFRVGDADTRELEGGYPWPAYSGRARCRALVEDHKGRLWCATAGAGLFYRDPTGQWRKIDSSPTLAHAEGLCLMAEEDDDLIWFGTRTSGLHCIRPQPPISVLHLPPECADSVVVSVFARRDGSVWAGTESAGAVCWKNGDVSRFGPEEGLSDPEVFVIAESPGDDLWAGTNKGLFRFSGSGFEPVAGDRALRSAVNDVMDDGRGGTWVATVNGLLHLADGEGRYFGRQKGVPVGLKRSLAIDSRGNAIAAVSGFGIYRQSGDNFMPMPAPVASQTAGTGGDARPWMFARSVCADADGSLWVTTHGFGLWYLGSGEAHQWTLERSGLPSNHLFGIIEDRQRNIWISSENGIFGIPRSQLARPSDLRSSPAGIRHLTAADGLPSTVCSGTGRSAAALGPDGRVWFANGPAVVGFNPEELPPPGVRREPIIEELIIDGLTMDQHSDRSVEIRSGARTFEFRYTSPDLLSPERLRFQFQLVGLDSAWIQAADRRSAYYNSLPPGDYRFRVRVRASGSGWRETATPLLLRVTPRLHERLPVRLGAGLILLAGVGGAARQIERTRSRRRLQQMEIQRARDIERQRIARDIHDDLGAGLTEIILLSDNLREEVPGNAPAGTTADAISLSARNLTRAMDEVVWAVDPGQDSLEGFLAYLNEFAQELLSHAGVRFRWIVPEEIPEIELSSEVRHSLYLACKEALNNSVRHSAAGEVHVRFEVIDSGFQLTIDDDGHGFATETCQQGLGHGLTNMMDRLSEIGGSCEITSTGSGTRVAFRIHTGNRSHRASRSST